MLTRVASLSSPPELVSKLLDPWEQQEHASSRRITTLVNELAGEVRNGHKQVVVLGAAPGARAMGVSTPQRAPRSASGVPPAARDGAALAADVCRRSLLTLGKLELPGGRVVSGRSSLVPLEVIKAKAALHVSDWDLDEVRCLCESGRLFKDAPHLSGWALNSSRATNLLTWAVPIAAP